MYVVGTLNDLKPLS